MSTSDRALSGPVSSVICMARTGGDPTWRLLQAQRWCVPAADSGPGKRSVPSQRRELRLHPIGVISGRTGASSHGCPGLKPLRDVIAPAFAPQQKPAVFDVEVPEMELLVAHRLPLAPIVA